MTHERGQPQHRRNPQARDRRQADRRGIAQQLERRVAFRRAMKRAVQSAMRLGAPGHPDQLLRPARRRRNRPHGMVSRRPRAAAHAARRCRFRLRHGQDHLRHLWRQGVGVQGRDPGARPDGAGQARRGRPPASHERGRTRTARTGKTSCSPKRTKYRKAHKGRIHGLPRAARAQFRRLRPEGDRAGPRHRAPDRGGAARDHPPHPPRRPRVDPHLPGCAGVDEAGRSPHGQRQGLARILDLPGQAGPDHVRARRRAGARWRARRSSSPPRSCRSRRASSRAPARRAWHEGATCAPRPTTSSTTELETSARRSSTCAFSAPAGSSRTPLGCGRCGATSRASRRSLASARREALRRDRDAETDTPGRRRQRRWDKT